MQFMVLRSGGQLYQRRLQENDSLDLRVSTHIRPVEVDDPPDPAMTVVYTLQTDIQIVGNKDVRNYTVIPINGSMSEKIEGALTGDEVRTLNLQPGDYEITIHSGSDNVLVG